MESSPQFKIHQILDPSGTFLSIWNRIFLVLCIFALFIDPFFFYLPYVGGIACISINWNLFILLMIIRSFTDFFYLTNIILKFRTAFILPGSTFIGKGELAYEPRKIAKNYLETEFFIDLAAVVPLPQFINIYNLIYLPNTGSRTSEHANNVFSLIVLLQYVPRFLVIFPLSFRIIKNRGVVTKSSWAGACYNLFLYMLASHVFGSSWYLLSIQRMYTCWTMDCAKDSFAYYCNNIYLDCRTEDDKNRQQWLSTTSAHLRCNGNKENQFKYGIFAEAVLRNIFSRKFSDKYLYCLWWGLSNMSSFGQNLETSGHFPEIAFCFFICMVGLGLFCHLIANIQTYLQSMTTKFELWREKMKDTETWMRYRGLPLDLQERIHKYMQYKWSATNDIDEASIMRSLPADLRRNVRRHICFDLIYQVNLFSQMDNNLQDAICERLISSLSIAGAYIIHEGEPVEEMLFVLRGKLEICITDEGRNGFLKSIVLGSGDFCGEELLTWALMPNPSQVLPSSTRTVRALADIEGFALQAADLKYVANQFKRLHNNKLQHIFRFHSHQWRTWAACYIQAKWRQFKKRKLLEELLQHVSLQDSGTENDQHVRFTKLVAICRAVCHILGTWKQVKSRPLSQILEMCESSDLLQNQNEAMNSKDAESSLMDHTIIEMERSEEADEPTNRGTGGESSSMEENSNSSIQPGAIVLASQFHSKLTGIKQTIDFIETKDSTLQMLKLRKPRDPAFSKHIDSG